MADRQVALLPLKGWEYKGGTHDGTTLARDVLPAYEVYSGVDEQAAQINGDVYAISHGDAIAWDRGSAATYLNVYDIAGSTTRTKRITGWLLNSLSDIQLTSDRVFYRVTGGFLFPMTTIGSAPASDL
ncbi:hypothetical protein ABZ387_04255 [Streptomyces flaveolus]|uniref:hypothetical protein n=1 Tax=Streptomyces flaveolus TaxID=67297 RepID=UPI0033CDD91C